MRYLTIDELIKINEALIGKIGGLIGIVDKTGLTESIERPKMKAGDYEPFPTIWDKAAVLMETIVKTRPFANTNALTSFLAAVMMLRLNGYILRPEPGDGDEIISITFLQMTVPQIADWFKNKSISILSGDNEKSQG